MRRDVGRQIPVFDLLVKGEEYDGLLEIVCMMVHQMELEGWNDVAGRNMNRLLAAARARDGEGIMRAIEELYALLGEWSHE